jgi:uncharacterized protein
LEGAERIVLFFDELPWLASPRSEFLSALNYFWNRHASRMSNVLLIVCGSAASWMIKKVINNRGGLHGRLSAQMRLLPFTLAETEQYLLTYGTELPRKQICELYMVLGGVPKYLSYIQRGHSATQIINALCFTAQAPLLTEFHKLYASLFDGSENHIAVIRALASATRSGLSRSELIQHLPNGGGASKVLEELEECGFISGQPGLGKQKRDRFYRLTDEYSLFYFRWIDQVKSTLLQNAGPDYWNQRRGTPAWNNWAGRAFESLCLKHAVQIKRALAIGGVITTQGHWEYRPTRKSDEEGAEIDLVPNLEGSNNLRRRDPQRQDARWRRCVHRRSSATKLLGDQPHSSCQNLLDWVLVIDRADNCVNLCEIKFSDSPYLITKKYAADLDRKKRVFRERTNSRKGLFTTLITPHGLKETPHAHASVDRAITLDSLFS